MTLAAQIVQDHARRVLEGLPLSQEDRQNLWDAYYSVDSPSALAHIFSRLPASVSEPLVNAKKFGTLKAVRPEDEFAMRHVLKAMHAMASVDPEILRLAEKYPQILKQFIQAAMK